MTHEVCVGSYHVYKECDTAKDRPLYIVKVDSASRRIVNYYPEGGGFAQQCDPKAFLEKYRRATPADQTRFSAFKDGLFYWEWSEGHEDTADSAPNKSIWCWPGYCTDTRWNGWPVPYFTKTVFEAYIKHHCDGVFMGVMWYGDDCFWYDDNNQEVIKAIHTHLPDGTSIYGVDGWCWNDLGPYDDLSEARMLMPWHESVDNKPLKEGESATRLSRADLSIEAQAWIDRHCFPMVRRDERVYDRLSELFKSDELRLTEKQYINNWLYRWEHCDDS